MNRVALPVLLLSRTSPLDRILGTSIGGDALHGRVVDVVAWPLARVALKGMQKTEPVARFVHGRLPVVVAVHGAFGHGVCVDVAAVAVVDGGVFFAVCNGGWECAFTQDAAGEVGLEVQVQGIVGALAEGLFHGGVGVAAASGPGVVGGPAYVDEVEGDVVGLVRVVERVELRLRHVVVDAGFGVFFGDDVEGYVDADGAAVACCEGCTAGS